MVLQVFLSWQTATESQGFNNKSLLIDCVQSVLKQIQNKGELKDIYFEFKEGLRGESGTPNVSEKMMELVDSCDIFIGDMTVTQKTGGCIGVLLQKLRIQNFRKEPNANVFGEYNRALKKYCDFYKQIILVLNNVNGEPEKDIDVIPFDQRGRRFPIIFTLKNNKKKSIEKAKQQLEKVLPDAIRKAAKAAIENIDKRYAPFVTWSNHSNNNEFSGQYEWTDALKSLKKQLNESKGVVRLLGLSGLGKTRLVLESFRATVSQSHYLYCDCQQYEDSIIMDTIRNIFQNNVDAVLVLDNCTQSFLGNIIKQRKSFNTGTKVITVFNMPNENRSNCDGITYIEMNERYPDVVEQILKRFQDINPEYFSRIKDFSDGIPMMAELLVKGLKNGKDIGNLGNTQLISRMLECDEKSDERKVLQSLSLFDYIGHEKERRNEMEFVATTPSITSIDKSKQVLLNLFDEVIAKYLKCTILEKRGRQIGIRPTPLAMYLVSEWLNCCSTERMLAVVKAIQYSEINKVLVAGFHNQFKYMGFNTNAREMLNKLMGTDSPFGSAEVLNTEVGSHLFRTFVEVNPIAVSELLIRVLGSMSIESLKSIDEGRRNLVWTIEKLCFDNNTFQNGAYLMMRMGLAENETWANNATGEFVRIFPLYLPATSASLEERLNFLHKHIQDEENKPLIMRALKRALSARDFIYMSGAEERGVNKLKPYEPKTNTEIIQYIQGCLNMVFAEIKNHSQYINEAKDILESDIISLCMFRMADISIPYIKKVGVILDNNWDKMQETLAFFEDTCMPFMSPDTQKEYKAILNSLTKNDFISRFRRIEKENRKNLDFNMCIEQQHNKYKSMAEELFKSNKLDDSILGQLIETTCISSYPFGEHLSQLMDSNKKQLFVSNYVRIANTLESPNYQILIDFISVLDEQSFANALQDILKIRDTRYIFAIWGRRGYRIGNKYFDMLIELVNKNLATSSDFIQYQSYIKIGSLSEDEIIQFLSVILPMKGGFATIMKMYEIIMFGRGEMTYSKLNKFVSESMINYNDSPTAVIFVENATHIANVLLNATLNKKLAHRLHEAILNYIKTADGYVSMPYELEELYRTLFCKYFDTIWPTLSEALLSVGENYMTYYNLKNIVGGTISGKAISLFQEYNHDDIYLQWCEQYPDIAPARIMSIVTPIDNDGEFIPIVKIILEKYADRPYVLNELGCNIGSFSSVGSVIPHYEAQKKTYETLLNHSRQEVRDWAKRQINSCDYLIDHESVREAERM